MKLYMFVETLGSYVKEQCIFKREKGIQAISSVLLHLPQDYLNESELQFITTFYCNRLKGDYHVMSVVLDGIQALVSIYLQNSFILCIIFLFH